MDFTFSRPVAAAVIAKRHVDLALAAWGVLIAGFYATAADRGERPNVRAYRWAMISFFALEGGFYLLILLKYQQGMVLYAILGLLVPISCFTALGLRLSKAGNLFRPAPTKFAAASSEDLLRLYSERPHDR
jgi:hypothetical protein